MSVHCELGVECVLTGLCCVLDDVLGYKEEPLTVEPLFKGTLYAGHLCNEGTWVCLKLSVLCNAVPK